jgi:hypothetical protein
LTFFRPYGDSGGVYPNETGSPFAGPKALAWHVITQWDVLERIDYVRRSKFNGFNLQLNMGGGGGVPDDILNKGIVREGGIRKYF